MLQLVNECLKTFKNVRPSLEVFSKHFHTRSKSNIYNNNNNKTKRSRPCIYIRKKIITSRETN